MPMHVFDAYNNIIILYYSRAHYNIWSLYNTRYYYYYTVVPVSAPIRRARTGTGSEGDSRRTGRVNPAPRPLVRAMYTPAGLVAAASTCDVRRMRRGPEHLSAAGRAPSTAAADAAGWGDRIGRERGTRTTSSPARNRSHSLRRRTPENAPAAAHLSEFDAGTPRTSPRQFYNYIS